MATQLKRILPVFLFAAATAGTLPGAEYRFLGGLSVWGEPVTWVPRGVPGEGDTVIVAEGEALFLETDRNIGILLADGAPSGQVIGRGGPRLLLIEGTLTSTKPRGVLRFRGNASAGGSDFLRIEAGAIEAVGEGRISLGEYHPEQSDRFLRGLAVDTATRIEGGATVEHFSAPGAPIHFGRVEFGPGGGTLLLNNGSGARRIVHLAGISGGADARVANSELRPQADFVKSFTRIDLEVPEGIRVFEGSLVPRAGGEAAGNRIAIRKTGLGVQVFAGACLPQGPVLVEAGGLALRGGELEAESVSVYDGAVFGGSGDLGGNLTINSGGLLYFRPGATLRVGGRIWLSPDFGVDRLRGPLEEVTEGRYQILENPWFGPGPYGLRNWGPDQAASLADGRVAYFEGPGLTLVVRRSL